MWLDIADAPADVPRDHGPVAEPLQDRVREPRAADRRRQPQLVATGQEDARRIADRQGRQFVIGLRPGDRVERMDPRDAELTEHRLVPLARLEPQRRRRRDDRDRGVHPAGERDEPAEDDPVPDLVLRPADDDDGPFGHKLHMVRCRSPDRMVVGGEDTALGCPTAERSTRRSRSCDGRARIPRPWPTPTSQPVSVRSPDRRAAAAASSWTSATSSTGRPDDAPASSAGPSVARSPGCTTRDGSRRSSCSA